jgi:EPS-associated MarR family transcriptional regulator
MLTDEVRYNLLRLLEERPQVSQRDVARHLKFSVGKANYCLQSLVEKGWIKAIDFKNSRNKSAYMYFLTRRGFQGKARVTARFLVRKMQEYEQLRVDIERLRAEADGKRGD